MYMVISSKTSSNRKPSITSLKEFKSGTLSKLSLFDITRALSFVLVLSLIVPMNMGPVFAPPKSSFGLLQQVENSNTQISNTPSISILPTRIIQISQVQTMPNSDVISLKPKTTTGLSSVIDSLVSYAILSLEHKVPNVTTWLDLVGFTNTASYLVSSIPLTVPQAYATSFTAIQNGNWNDTATWGCAIPGHDDSITIPQPILIGPGSHTIKAIVNNAEANTGFLAIGTFCPSK
jgi:hypothetical protein